jgi:hypothetical protein
MVIFCLDLTVAVIAHRAGRGPDLLVHDSHLFDGVDGQQIARVLKVAREVADQEGIQYIALLNSDDLGKAQRRGFDPEGAVIEPPLTDERADGGLFGSSSPDNSSSGARRRVKGWAGKPLHARISTLRGIGGRRWSNREKRYTVVGARVRSHEKCIGHPDRVCHSPARPLLKRSVDIAAAT